MGCAVIYVDEKRGRFHLQGRGYSYCLQLDEEGRLLNLHWGGRIPDADLSQLLSFYWEGASFDLRYGRLPLELPTPGAGYYGTGALSAVNPNGDSILCLQYKGYTLTAGKPALPGLPASYVESPDEAQTLTLLLEDELLGLRVRLMYTVFANYDVLARSMAVENAGKAPLELTCMLSASVPLYGCDYDLLHLKGGWGRERAPQRVPLNQAISRVESRRGASGHEQNPFLAVLEKSATEFQGRVWGQTLVYSGSFLAEAAVNNFGHTRLSIGLHPDMCHWRLAPGESFQTPEALLVYSDQGLNGMSQAFHALIRQRVCRGYWRDRQRPVLINNWEGTYFDFTEEKLLAIAEKARDIGVELFVLDDGWFGKRNTDTCSLGDWVVNLDKLPGGIRGLSEKMHGLGLLFGLWFEPEMVSPDSDLYRAHPDWCLHAKDRVRTQARHQLILDLSRQDVQDYVIQAVASVLERDGVDYVKWDMNRNMTEPFSALLPAEGQLETQHRYMLGLYRVLETLTARFPKVLFESCSGGGGRFDCGLLYYMPQTWTSDDTDANERLQIQYGTSIVYPPAAMGAHVSAVPNHQTGRIASFQMRGNVALAGNFGFELDLTALPQQELDQAKEQVLAIKSLRDTLQKGVFTRLESPFEGNFAAWQFLSQDGADLLFCAYQRLVQPNPLSHRIRLRGLEPEACYRTEDGQSYSGGRLMEVGLPIPLPKEDFSSYILRLHRS